jgi:predicted nuclease of predicted toxin-antitoxin system
VKNFLESKGYAAQYPPKGMKNRELASLALREGYILVTRDYDFANTISFPPKQFHGIIVLHIHPPKAEKLIREMESLLAKIKDFKGKLLIIKDGKIEIIEAES